MKLAVAAAAWAVMNVASASVFTMSSTGIVKVGVDDRGLFSAPGTKLNGLPFALTVTLELDDTAVYSIYPAQYSAVKATTPYVVALTVGDYHYAFRVTDRAQTQADLVNGGGGNQAALYANGYDDLGRINVIRMVLNQANLRSNSLSQYLELPANSANTNFQIGSGAGSTGFYAYAPGTFTINGTPATLPAPDPIPDPAPAPNPSAVPEPATAMLFGAGLLGVAALRRRRSRR
jgi:hypothetical protein